MRPFIPMLMILAGGVASSAEPPAVTTPSPPRTGAGTEYDGVKLPQAATATAAVMTAAVAIDPAVTIKPLSTDLLGITLGGRQCDDLFMGGTGTAVTTEMRALLPSLPPFLPPFLPPSARCRWPSPIPAASARRPRAIPLPQW